LTYTGDLSTATALKTVFYWGQQVIFKPNYQQLFDTTRLATDERGLI
jgi:hypothetical protein